MSNIASPTGSMTVSKWSKLSDFIIEMYIYIYTYVCMKVMIIDSLEGCWWGHLWTSLLNDSIVSEHLERVIIILIFCSNFSFLWIVSDRVDSEWYVVQPAIAGTTKSFRGRCPCPAKGCLCVLLFILQFLQRFVRHKFRLAVVLNRHRLLDHEEHCR